MCDMLSKLFYIQAACADVAVHEARAFHVFMYFPKNMLWAGISFCIHYCCVWAVCFTTFNLFFSFSEIYILQW